MYLTAPKISQLAVEVLRRDFVLPNTVCKVAAEEYNGPSGGTVTIRVPQPRSAREQLDPGATITFTAIQEHPVRVPLRHFYDATRVTDEDLTLTLENFGRQVLYPQVSAVATAAEDQVAAAMNALPANPNIGFAETASPEDTRQAVLEIREALTVAGVPIGDRYLAVAPDIATRILMVPDFVRVDATDERDGLREATVGKLFGLTVVESAAITFGTAIGYHFTAFGFGSAAPSHVAGGASSNVTVDGQPATAVSTAGNVTLRHLMMFDPTRLASVSVVSLFAGVSPVTENESGAVPRAIRVVTTAE